MRDTEIMTAKRKAWDYALGLCKVDGGEPSDTLLALIEKEIKGEISNEDIHRMLIEKYTVK